MSFCSGISVFPNSFCSRCQVFPDPFCSENCLGLKLFFAEGAGKNISQRFVFE